MRFHSKHNHSCKHTLLTEHKIITGERHLKAVFSSHSDQPLSEVIVTLREWKLPQPNLSSSSKNVANIGLAAKFTTHQVPHSKDHSTHILHPDWGYASVLYKKDGHQSYSPVITSKLSIPIPACLTNLIHPAPEHNLKINPALTPGCQSLDPDLSTVWLCTTLTTNSLVGNKTRHNKRWVKWCLCTVNMKVKIWHYF